MPHEFSEDHSSQTGETAPETNPYASPGVQGPHLIPSATAIGIWRLGNALVMHRDAVMPPRCFHTNQPCDKSEARTYFGRSKLVNWLWQLAFLTLVGATGVVAMTLFRSFDLPNRWETARGILALVLLAWLIAPAGNKGIRIVYYHSAASRRRQRQWSIAGFGVITVGISLSLFYALDEPAWLSKEFVWAPSLLVVGGWVILKPNISFGADHYQGPYLLVSDCGREFIASFPECTIEFPQTAGTWIKRAVQAIG